MPEMSLSAALAGMKEWFATFCGSFREKDPKDQANYDLKELHTHYVCEAARIIAAGGDERRLFLAEVAALCHDLGRFRQFQRYRTFKDSDSVNHAHLSAQILCESSILDTLPAADRELVLTAVRFHNAFTIPAGLSPEAEDLLKVVRDADKVDIWRVFIEFYAAPEEGKASAAALGLPDGPCSDEVIHTLEAGELVSLSIIKTINDFKLLQLSWVYDINFASTLRLIRERRIVERLAATLPQEEAVLSAVAAVQRYLETKLQGAAPA